MSSEQKASNVVHAYAAYGPKEELKAYEYEREPLDDTSVLVQVSHCGVCHSDIHLIDKDWGEFSQFPQVCGHEIVGTVKEIGKSVTSVITGDRVGVGWVRQCCLKCRDCMNGNEQLCDNNVLSTGGGSQGGFADYFRADESFLFRIPPKLKSEYAAPLMCAGITAYTPLAKHSIPSDRVGVVGIGGLGHLAVKFARARGNHVVAISRGKDKEEFAKSLGANEYVDSNDASEMKKQIGKLDLIIITIDAKVDYMPYVKMVRKSGTVCFVGAAAETVLPVPVMHLVNTNIKITGSATGSRHSMVEMLEFAATNNVYPDIEIFEFSDVNKAIAKVRNNTVRFRAVLTNKL